MNNEITTHNTLPALAEEVQQKTVAFQGQMDLKSVLAQVSFMQSIMSQAMKENKHYGTIPDCGNKKVLYKSGAEILAFTFRLKVLYDLELRDLGNGHREYEVIATVKCQDSDLILGQGVGNCSTMENKYRYRNTLLKCPSCEQASVIRGKKEYGGGWLCYKARGGCGMKWPNGAKEIERQSVGKTEHDNPADYYNTVLKMAKKRAYVDAIITVTSCSDTFTQDLEEKKQDANGFEYSYDDNEEDPKQKKESKNDAPNGLISVKQIGFARKLMENYSTDELKIIKEEMLQGDKTLPKTLEEYSTYQAKVLIDKLKFTKEHKKIIDESNNYGGIYQPNSGDNYNDK